MIDINSNLFLDLQFHPKSISRCCIQETYKTKCKRINDNNKGFGRMINKDTKKLMNIKNQQWYTPVQETSKTCCAHLPYANLTPQQLQITQTHYYCESHWQIPLTPSKKVTINLPFYKFVNLKSRIFWDKKSHHSKTPTQQ